MVSERLTERTISSYFLLTFDKTTKRETNNNTAGLILFKHIIVKHYCLVYFLDKLGIVVESVNEVLIKSVFAI